MKDRNWVYVLIIVILICITTIICFNSTNHIIVGTNRDINFQAQKIEIHIGNDTILLCNVFFGYSNNVQFANLYETECNK